MNRSILLNMKYKDFEEGFIQYINHSEKKSCIFKLCSNYNDFHNIEIDNTDSEKYNDMIKKYHENIFNNAISVFFSFYVDEKNSKYFEKKLKEIGIKYKNGQINKSEFKYEFFKSINSKITNAYKDKKRKENVFNTVYHYIQNTLHKSNALHQSECGKYYIPLNIPFDVPKARFDACKEKIDTERGNADEDNFQISLEEVERRARNIRKRKIRTEGLCYDFSFDSFKLLDEPLSVNYSKVKTREYLVPQAHKFWHQCIDRIFEHRPHYLSFYAFVYWLSSRYVLADLNNEINDNSKDSDSDKDESNEGDNISFQAVKGAVSESTADFNLNKELMEKDMDPFVKAFIAHLDPFEIAVGYACGVVEGKNRKTKPVEIAEVLQRSAEDISKLFDSRTGLRKKLGDILKNMDEEYRKVFLHKFFEECENCYCAPNTKAGD